MNKTYKVGDIVYCNDLRWSGALGVKVKVLEIRLTENIISAYKVEPLDNIFSPIRYIFPNEIFDTREEAVIQGEKDIDNLVERYKNKIQSVEDLLLYPLKNFDISDEYTDPEAVTAYVEKVKELFNIDLSDKL